MKKFVITLLILISVTAISFRYFKNSKKKVQQNTPQAVQKQESSNASTTPPSETTSSSTTTTQNSKPVKTYTMADVAAHGADPDSEDCWTAIHGKVYDIINFIQIHPGGEQISQICGKDGTALFESRPTDPPTPHSAEARKILEKYYIGDLKQ